jgi:ribosome-binding ATPase YchF (GTP1/OBG family)
MIKAIDRLKDEKKLSEFDYASDEFDFIKVFNFLTLKPTIFIANVSEDEASSPETSKHFAAFSEYVKSIKADFVVVSAQIEYEISKLEGEDQKEFLDSLGLTESGLTTVSKMAFKTLGLATYFTCGPEEAHA